ncbi:MAG: hypothetical protein ACYCVZ_00190 [Streptosporangiaceae bacterium]
MAQAVTSAKPPGAAKISKCPDCQGAGCEDCDHTGKILWKACPRCGDTAWDYVNGYSEDAGMICRLGCGHRWTADDGEWLAQVLPRHS